MLMARAELQCTQQIQVAYLLKQMRPIKNMSIPNAIAIVVIIIKESET